MKFSKIEKIGNRYFGNYPFKGELPDTLFDVTNELKVVRKVEEATWDNLCLTLSGYAYVEKLDIKNKNKLNVNAYILNPDTNIKVEVPVHLRKRTDITHKKRN